MPGPFLPIPRGVERPYKEVSVPSAIKELIVQMHEQYPEWDSQRIIDRIERKHNITVTHDQVLSVINS